MKFSPSLFILIQAALFFGACTQQIDTTGTNSGGGTTSGGSGTSDPSKASYTPPSNTGDSTGGGSTSTGSGGSSGKDTLTLTDTVLTPCQATNISVQFILTGTKMPKSYTCEWYFGDGNQILSGPATVINPYVNGTGTYTVIAKVDTGGVSIASISKTITLAGAKGTPVVAFTSTCQNPTGSANVYAFNSTSTTSAGTIKSYIWDFGDGQGNTSNYTYVTHTYTVYPSAQSYVATLTATGSSGCTSYKSITVNIPAGSSVISGTFSDTSTSPCSPSIEQFSFVSNVVNLPPNVVYNWDFGDGSKLTGSSVTHSYSNAGIYVVKLTVTSLSTGTLIYSTQNNVTAYGQNVTPQASFTAVKGSTSGYVVNFQSTSTVPNGSISSNRWQFGDHTSAPFSFFQKTYNTAGTYQVILTSTSNANCPSQIVQNITVPLQ